MLHPTQAQSRQAGVTWVVAIGFALSSAPNARRLRDVRLGDAPLPEHPAQLLAVPSLACHTVLSLPKLTFAALGLGSLGMGLLKPVFAAETKLQARLTATHTHAHAY